MKSPTLFANAIGLFTFAVCCGLVTCMLIPTLAQSRQAARSSGCVNNFRQIGIALHNYHMAYKQLPSGTGGTTGGEASGLSNAGRIGPLVSILPFLDQQPLWTSISSVYTNPETNGKYPPMGPVPWFPPSRYQPWQMSPGIYHCPEQPLPEVYRAAPLTVFTWEAPSKLSTTANYVACYGDGTYLQAGFSVGDEEEKQRSVDSNRGIFTPGRSLKFRGVTDGLSNTIVYSEVIADRYRQDGVNEIARDVTGLSKNPSLCIAAIESDDTKFWIFGRGGSWADGFLPISGFQTILPPGSPSCTSDLGMTDVVASVTSHHAGGVFVLFADGASRFASESIDVGDITQPGVTNQPGYSAPKSESPYGIWGALGSRNARERISEMIGFEKAFGTMQLSHWTNKKGKTSLIAEFVQIIDQESIQLKALNGVIHEVPLSDLSKRNISRAKQLDAARLRRSTN